MTAYHPGSLAAAPRSADEPAFLPRVGYQGVAGAFGEDAVCRRWQGRAQPHPMRTFGGVLDALSSGDVEWAVVPVWNSAIGRIASAWDALDEHAEAIVCVDEIDMPVQHCLLALPGSSIEDIRYVGSHPAALAQCAQLFDERRGLIACDAFDTAGAALELSRHVDRASFAEPWYACLEVDGPSRLAVIASESAARCYGLAVLERSVQDDAENVTRFAVIRARAGTPC